MVVRSVREVRHPEGRHDHALWRLHPERWLESRVVGCAEEVDERLDSDYRYSQVPTFSASDRAMIDVLTVTRNGRLAAVERKADEDIHLPLQGLDYWARVAWHHARASSSGSGIFPSGNYQWNRHSCFWVAPALHVHPATDTLLHYLFPEIAWTWWVSMSDGGMESRRCFGNGRETGGCRSRVDGKCRRGQHTRSLDSRWFASEPSRFARVGMTSLWVIRFVIIQVFHYSLQAPSRRRTSTSCPR
jgi:hypothetical protein